MAIENGQISRSLLVLDGEAHMIDALAGFLRDYLDSAHEVADEGTAPPDPAARCGQRIDNGFTLKACDPKSLLNADRSAAAGCDVHQALRDERALFQDLLRSISDGVFIKDADGRYLRLNEAECEIIGASDPEDATGRTFWDFLPPDLAEQWSREEQIVLDGTRRRYTTRRQVSTRDGIRTYNVNLAMRQSAQGGSAGLVGVSRDVTEFTRQADHLEQANRLLVAGNRELADFTYAVSHDLKAPTGTMQNLMLELLKPGPDRLDPEREQLVQAALDTALRMGCLIDDVMTYSRAVEDRVGEEEVDLNAVMHHVMADLADDIAATGAVIGAADLPTVRGSPSQLGLLFRHLIANALKFRDPERAPQVDVIGTPIEGGAHIFEIRDNGIGIAPGFQDRIFELFTRLHTHDTYPGSGLGLTLCRRIVSNHFGSISVASEPGTGSTFRFSLERDAP